MLERLLIGLTFVAGFFFVIEFFTYRALCKAYKAKTWWKTARRGWWGVHVVAWAAFLAAFFMWPTWRGTHPVLLKTILGGTFALTIPKFSSWPFSWSTSCVQRVCGPGSS